MLASLGFVLSVLASGSPADAAHAGRVVLSAAASSATTPAGTVLVTVDDSKPAPGESASATGSPGFVASRTAASDAEDQALAEALDGAKTIELRGGSWIGWYHASHAGRHEREWTRALRRAHAAGAEVRASGGAAAWVAPWAPVPRAVLDKPSQDPHDTSLDLPVEGLGLFEGPLVGVLTPDAPTADRVVERALAYGYRDVLLLAGDAQFEWEPATRSARIRIPSGGSEAGWIAWVDLGAGRRSRDVVRGARVAIPRDGDVFATRLRTLEGGQALRGEPREDPGVARLIEELGRARGSAAWVRGVVTSRDDASVRSAHGGLGAVGIDLEIHRP